jgi:hypothetical protein
MFHGTGGGKRELAGGKEAAARRDPRGRSVRCARQVCLTHTRRRASAWARTESILGLRMLLPNLPNGHGQYAIAFVVDMLSDKVDAPCEDDSVGSRWPRSAT